MRDFKEFEIWPQMTYSTHKGINWGFHTKWKFIAYLQEISTLFGEMSTNQVRAVHGFSHVSSSNACKSLFKSWNAFVKLGMCLEIPLHCWKSAGQQLLLPEEADPVQAHHLLPLIVHQGQKGCMIYCLSEYEQISGLSSWDCSKCQSQRIFIPAEENITGINPLLKTQKHTAKWSTLFVIL